MRILWNTVNIYILFFCCIPRVHDYIIEPILTLTSSSSSFSSLYGGIFFFVLLLCSNYSRRPCYSPFFVQGHLYSYTRFPIVYIYFLIFSFILYCELFFFFFYYNILRLRKIFRLSVLFYFISFLFYPTTSLFCRWNFYVFYLTFDVDEL